MFIKRRVKLVLILTNKSVRKTTFRKKNNSIMEKLKEVETTVKSDQEQQRRITKSKEEMQLEKMIKEAKQELRKLEEENRTKELLIHMFRVRAETGNFPVLEGVTKKELKGLQDLINANVKKITQEMEELKKDEATAVRK
ncbi:hypothetical protein HKD37_02G005471 [Glycine soja]|uniref:Uncharacterized protein n=2 Tax=Glycine subgen. Soja TaxID=1462606 RepID=I1JHL9_SOYBN|nr:hypothetical protein JHK87_005041 [Glycine soja]